MTTSQSYNLNDVHQRLQNLGENSAVLRATGWPKLGDIVAKENNLRLLTYDNVALKSSIKKMGGIIALWREQHPKPSAEFTHLWGSPSH